MSYAILNNTLYQGTRMLAAPFEISLTQDQVELADSLLLEADNGAVLIVNGRVFLRPSYLHGRRVLILQLTGHLPID